MKWFNPTPTTAEQLKAEYKKLAMEHHPDPGRIQKHNQCFNQS